MASAHVNVGEDPLSLLLGVGQNDTNDHDDDDKITTAKKSLNLEEYEKKKRQIGAIPKIPAAEPRKKSLSSNEVKTNFSTSVTEKSRSDPFVDSGLKFSPADISDEEEESVDAGVRRSASIDDAEDDPEGIFTKSANEEDDDETQSTPTFVTSGKGSLFGGFAKETNESVERKELKVAEALGTTTTTGTLFSSDLDQEIVASAKENSAAQLDVSEEKLKRLDLFVDSSDDKGGSSNGGFSASSATFGGEPDGPSPASAGDASDLFAMIGTTGAASGTSAVGDSFDFSSYIKDNI